MPFAPVLSGHFAYIPDVNGVSIFGIFDPAQPRPLATLWLPGGATDVAVAPDYLYVVSAGLLAYAQSFDFHVGDVTDNGTIDAADIIYLINFVFRSGPPPQPIDATGDFNCDGAVNATDIIGLVDYVFRAGSPPVEPCN